MEEMHGTTLRQDSIEKVVTTPKLEIPKTLRETFGQELLVTKPSISNITQQLTVLAELAQKYYEELDFLQNAPGGGHQGLAMNRISSIQLEIKKLIKEINV